MKTKWQRYLEIREDVDADDVCGIYPSEYIGVHPDTWGSGNPYIAASKKAASDSDQKKKKHKKKKKDD